MQLITNYKDRVFFNIREDIRPGDILYLEDNFSLTISEASLYMVRAHLFIPAVYNALLAIKRGGATMWKKGDPVEWN
jgi:hypothetical protein